MGHLINPISNRLSINSFWNSNWALINNFNYINVFKQDYLLFKFLDWFTKKSKFGKFNIIISHYKVFRSFDKVFVNFYYYNAGLEEKKYYFQVNSLLNLLKKRARIKNFSNETFKTNSISKIRVNSLYSYIIKVVISNLYWYLINKSLSFFINKLNHNSDNYYFNTYSLDFFNVTTDIIATYISLKLQQRYSLNWVLRPILKDLTSKMKSKVFSGYKIVCSGRFTRKQIATYMWMKQGSLQLNNFSSLVKYSQASIKLKYGLCGIKVWLNYGFNDLNLFKRNLMLVYPLYTPFKYVINIKSKELTLYLNYWFFSYLRISFIKSRFFNFYKLFLHIKIKILLKYVFKKLFSNIWYNKFKIGYANNNTFTVSIIPKLNVFSSLKKYDNN